MRKIKLSGRAAHLEQLKVGEIVELIPMNDNKGVKYVAVHSDEPFLGRCHKCSLFEGPGSEYNCSMPYTEDKIIRKDRGSYSGVRTKLCVSSNVYLRPAEELLEDL